MSLSHMDQPAHIVALDADVQPADYLMETDTCTIGRSPLCQIIVQRSNVSRLHAKIERHGAECVLTDAGSANGTFVNGRRIGAPYRLQNCDLIGLGGVVALLRFTTTCPRF